MQVHVEFRKQVLSFHSMYFYSLNLLTGLRYFGICYCVIVEISTLECVCYYDCVNHLKNVFYRKISKDALCNFLLPEKVTCYI